MVNKLKDMSAGQILAVAAFLTVAAFGCWVGFLFVLWFGVGFRHIGGDLWGAIEGLSSAATLASVIGGGVIALVQLVESVESRQREVEGREREMESRNLEIYNYTFERLMSDDNIAARRWIYMNIDMLTRPEEGVRLITQDPAGQRHVKLVLNSFDHLGFLIQQDWITSNAVLDWVSPFVVKTWERLGPYVAYEAQRRNEPDYYEAARFLAERCAALRAEKYGRDVKSNYVENAI